MKATFKTRIIGVGNNTGIEVPEANVAELNAGKRPPVIVNVNDYTYRSTVAVMWGKYMISLPKAHREASGISANDAVTVTLELEDGPRPVDVPAALRTALKDAGLEEAFDALSYSARKEFARQVSDAKAEDTKARRIAKVIDSLTVRED